ncbi:UNVERIFIED_CONTAM: Copia protein [Sesamum radiatum]|uniref:Copia protein n=1 Tax=Sesamum radiatum TaxID=300843 RepID=A0AAW2WBK6_SESRA
MQFLMGLHDSFSNKRSQVLMLDPLPDIEKTFSMVYAVEKQRAVHTDLEATFGHMAYQMAVNDDRKSVDKSVQWKKPFVDKRSLTCTHCHKRGHARETCFQVHGVPDWYKTLRDKKKKGKPFTANVEVREEGSTKVSSPNVTEIVAEVLKMMKKNNPISLDPLTTYANFAHFDEEFAGHASVQALKHVMEVGCNDISADIPCDICHKDKQNKQTESPTLPLPVVPLQSNYMLAPTDQPADPTKHIEHHHTPPTSTPQVNDSSTHVPLPVRRSQRHVHRLAWLNDFVSCVSNQTILYPSNGQYSLFIGTMTALQELRSYLEAVQHVEWRKAMQAELEALEQNCTWKLVHCLKMDVTNAFLHGHLKKDLYMSPPKGYSTQPGLVCKLERSIYGLKQASRQWNAELTLKLTDFGFSQLAHDHCLFTKETPTGLMALLVYVDNILVTTPTLALIQSVKDYLHSLFTIKDLRDARYFLGLEITRNEDGLYVAQTKYVQDIIQDTGLSKAKSTSTPIPLVLKLSDNSGALLIDPERYRRLIGRLLYLGFTRPDISHTVQQLSQFLTRPCDSHWQAAIHVVRYLKRAPSKGLFFPLVSSLELRAYCDADWASCTDSRRSLTALSHLWGDVEHTAATVVLPKPEFLDEDVEISVLNAG